MKLLVAGADRVDAGKTTFAVGLAAHLGAGGIEGGNDSADADAVTTVKPRAGNDYWFDHDDVLASTAQGRLYGKDVRRLTEVAGGVPEERNPIHRLWRPTPGRTGMLGDPNRTFLIDRVTTPSGPAWVSNANVDLPDVIRERLPVDDARPVDSVEAFNDVMRDLHLPALKRVTDRVRDADVAVVESYADIADPLPRAAVEYDAVAVVAPGRARVYDGARWETARAAIAGSDAEGQLEERVEHVTGMIDSVSTHEIPALSSEKRSNAESIADANRAAYDSLVSAGSD